MRKLIAEDDRLFLGKQGENLATRICFPTAHWRETYGEGTFVLLAQRKSDAAPYPVSITTDESCVYWDVSDSDTAIDGIGQCELQYIVGDVLAKSQTWVTRVAPALSAAGPDPPEPYQSWVDEVLAAGSQAEEAAAAAAEAAKSIEDMTVSAHSVTGDPTVDKTVEEGVVNLDFGIPSGGGGGGALPSGGTAGQILVKNSSLDNDASWQDLPVYDGSYEVTPLVNAETTMNTAQAYLDRDVVVKAIPYSEVSNLSGGLTVTIGG